MSAFDPTGNDPAAQSALHTRRIDAARHLLKPHQIRESLTLAAQPSLRNSTVAGLQSALTAAIALPAVYLSPWPHLIGFASLGALVALFGRFAAPAARGRILLLCALCQSFAVLAMSMAAWLGAPFAVQLMLLALGSGLFFLLPQPGNSALRAH